MLVHMYVNMEQFASYNGQMPGRNRGKTFSESLKARYTRACFIMSKIEMNERRGKPQACDQSDRQRCQIAIEEYLRYQQTQAEMQQKEEQAKKEQEKRKATQSEQPSTSKSAKNELCMALVNEKDGKVQPVVAEWPMIETRLSDILFKYLVHNKNFSKPRYDSGEIYRGYYLIQCKDLFSKEFLCNSIAQVKDEFKGLRLNVIEKDKIPKESKCLENLPKLDISNETLTTPPAPPSPPAWRKLSASRSARDQHKYYLNCLDHMKLYAAKGKKLNQNERRNERKCRRSIRKYEERHGLPATQRPNEAGIGPENNQGFQLSVNYFESDVTPGIRKQMEEFSNSSWGDQTYSNNFPEDQQDTLNWGANSSWNYKEMEPECYQQQMATSSAFNRQNFAEEISYNAGSNYDYELQPRGRSESSWHYGGAETETSYERNGNYVSFKPQNNFEFEREQISNSSWNYGEPQAESYQEMRGNTHNQDFNFKEGNNFDSGFNEMKQTEGNFQSNHVSNGLWNDSNQEFERRHEMRGNSSTNSQSPEPYSRARNNIESEQTWTTNQLPTTAWKYEEPKAENFNSSNPQFMRSHLNLEMRNSPQQVDTFASTSNGNKMTNSYWNHSDSTESLQTIKDPNNLPNKTATEEDAAKLLLEKRIFDLLNSLVGDNKGKKQFNQEELPNKPLNAQQKEFSQEKVPDPPTISPTELNKARENLTKSLRKPQSDLSETEVIILTDDSDQEEEPKEEEKKAEKEYFKALAYLLKLESRERSKSLTEQELFFKETSEFIVKQYEKKFGSKQQKTKQTQEKTNGIPNKRTRWSSSANNNNTLTCSESSNWNPSTNSTSTSNDTKPELKIAIIDRNEPNLSVPKPLWFKLEENLIKTVHQEVEKTNNINITQFDAKHWLYGFKIIQCENLEALYFIKRFIIKYTLQNPRRQYDVIPVSELPQRSTVKVWIPPPNACDKAMLKIIKAQNHTLHTDCWTLTNSRERPITNGKVLYISIPAASVEKLKLVKWEIRYGIRRLKLDLVEDRKSRRQE